MRKENGGTMEGRGREEREQGIEVEKKERYSIGRVKERREGA